MKETIDLFSIKEASEWATGYLGKNVTTFNISYLINYGKISKIGENGSTLISKTELIKYYESIHTQREVVWKNKLGTDLNWALSFDRLKETDTTKHVHRLHPYKGKFIPQLAEYFLDSHTDKFKTIKYFKKGDIILDPFCGSGTTLVQANELGIHGVGVDVSSFNALISNCKVSQYDIPVLTREIERITTSLSSFTAINHTADFDQVLSKELNVFNNQYFPTPDFKRKVQQKVINGDEYGQEKAKEFLPVYQKLVDGFGIELLQPSSNNFLEKWYSEHIRKEINFVFDKIKKIEDFKIKNILIVILSRTMCSCRATTHSDLATLKEPIMTTYYCTKHNKICKPLFSILKWWKTYCNDTVKRLLKFSNIRNNVYQFCITGDSRVIDIYERLQKYSLSFAGMVKTEKIRGIFSSPPYVGLIDYHEQHAYSYDLFGFERKDNLEIGPLYKGQGKAAKDSYIEGISDVLLNSKKYLVDDYDVFLVANDKYGLYPCIAERAGMKIVNQYKRPVLNRTEKDKREYAEIIFHLKK